MWLRYQGLAPFSLRTNISFEDFSKKSNLYFSFRLCSLHHLMILAQEVDHYHLLNLQSFRYWCHLCSCKKLHKKYLIKDNISNFFFFSQWGYSKSTKPMQCSYNTNNLLMTLNISTFFIPHLMHMNLLIKQSNWMWIQILYVVPITK